MRENEPVFTIVVATYQRGPLIASTLESIAAQTAVDFEVLVISDGPAAEGLAETVDRFGERFHLHQLQTRSRSQSGPNNYGWAAARGQYVAYLGHDDIWHSEHLERLAETFASDPGIGIAVSGCIFFGPPGATDEFTWVTGIFDSRQVGIARDHFFPPSSISHRRDLPDTVPRWPDAAASTDPVDVALLKGAVAAGLRFASTGVVTVYKFASAQRYLSYLYPDDREQRQMLERMQDPAQLRAYVAGIVKRARRLGKFMHLRYSNAEVVEPGGTMRKNERVRGITPTTVASLAGRIWLEPGDDPRGLDWYPAESYRGNPPRWRWSGPSVNPRLRIPVVAVSGVRFVVHIAAFASDAARESLEVYVNRNQVSSQLVDITETGTSCLIFDASLLAESESVVEFRMTEREQKVDTTRPLADPRPRGFCLLGTGIELASAHPGQPWPEADLAVRDRALAQRDDALSALDAVLDSTSWRYSATLRSLGTLWEKLRRNSER